VFFVVCFVFSILLIIIMPLFGCRLRLTLMVVVWLACIRDQTRRQAPRVPFTRATRAWQKRNFDNSCFDLASSDVFRHSRSVEQGWSANDYDGNLLRDHIYAVACVEFAFMSDGRQQLSLSDREQYYWWVGNGCEA
jgi:hypothetical protein